MRRSQSLQAHGTAVRASVVPELRLDAADHAEVAIDADLSADAAGDEALPNASLFTLIAAAFWAPDYTQIFDAEFAENERLCGGAAAALPLTSYRARLKGDAAHRYDQRRRNQQRDEMAIRLHSNNQQHWSPSLLARSICYYAKASRFVQKNETKQRRIASKPTVRHFLRIMREQKPKPLWARGQHIAVFAYDQTYQWVGVKKRGRRQSVERLDGSGMPLEIKHLVYINSMQVALPDRLGSLSQQDLDRIAANHGSAYTEPYNNILVPLLPDAVESSLLDFARDVCSSVDLVRASTPSLCSKHTTHVCVCNTCMHSHSHMRLLCVSQEATSLGVMPSRLTLRQIADAMFRPPNIQNGGPTDIDILPVLPDTDTKSYEDCHRTTAHLDGYCAASVKVKLDWTDGQGCITGALPTVFVSDSAQLD